MTDLIFQSKPGRPRLNLTPEEKEARYLKNLERAREYQAKRRKDNPERIKAIEKKHREEHREAYNARMKVHNTRRRNAKKLLAQQSSLNPNLKSEN